MWGKTPTPTPTPTPASWQPGQTFRQAGGTLESIFRFIWDALIWIVVVLLPIVAIPVLVVLLIVWLVRRSKRRPA